MINTIFYYPIIEELVFKTIFMYFFIIFVYRLMGKKEVGQLSIVDLIVSILIAELVVISVEDPNMSIFYSLIPVICLVVLQMLLSFVSLKNSRIRELLDGKPSFIIKYGKVNYNEMVRQKYNLDDLLVQLREKGYKSIAISITYQDVTKTMVDQEINAVHSAVLSALEKEYNAKLRQ